MPSMPAGAAAFVDASLTSTLKLSGVQALDGGNIDTWGSATLGGSNHPFYDSIALGGGPCVFFGGMGAPIHNTPSWMTLSSVALSIPYTLVTVVRSSGPAATVVEASSNVSAGRGYAQSLSNGWACQANGPNGMQQADHPIGQYWGIDNQIRCLIQVCDGTNIKLYENGILISNLAVSGSAPGTATFSVPVTIGAGHGGAKPLTGGIGIAYLYNHAFSASEVSQTMTYVNSLWRLTLNPPGRLAYSTASWGDSIATGLHTISDTDGAACGPFSYAGRGTNSIGFRFGTYANYGVSGAILQGITTNLSTNGIPTDAMPNVWMLEGGINNSESDATVEGLWQTYAETASGLLTSHSAHQQYVIVCTITSNSVRAAVNAFIRANYLSWGAAHVTMLLADFANDVVLSDSTGRGINYFADAIHPAMPGHERAGSIIASTLLGAGL